MIVERTFDRELIWSIMTEPQMWETVAEDGQDPQKYVPEVEREGWLLVYDEDDIYALYRIHAMNSTTCEIHTQVLPKHRRKRSLDTGVPVLKWIYENAPMYKKLVCWIPDIYPNVRAFAEHFGFKHEGTNRKSYMKNGELRDQWLLGITRDEIERIIA